MTEVPWASRTAKCVDAVAAKAVPKAGAVDVPNPMLAVLVAVLTRKYVPLFDVI